jgi:cytoskeletal protein CcmA (bactofilin family)
MEDNKQDSGGNSLETLEEQDTTVTSSPEQDQEETKLDKKKTPGSFLTKIAARINIYLLAFMLLILISVIIVFVVINASNKQAAESTDVKTQELTQEAIKNLGGSETTVGDPKQLLNVESNAVFNGKVLIRDGLDVAGPIKVGGEINLPGITVSGKSAFDEVQVNSLSIAGDTSVQGLLTVEKGLTVNGQASFGGAVSAASMTVGALSLTGDLQFARHIDAGGGTPTVASGAAVGSGGTVTVNVGSGAGAGVLATITFTNKFNGNPHVVFSPVDKAAPNAFVSNRTNNGFSLATSAGLAAGSISFDYIVID